MQEGDKRKKARILSHDTFRRCPLTINLPTLFPPLVLAWKSGDWGDGFDPWKRGSSGQPYDYGAWQYGSRNGDGRRVERRRRQGDDFTPWRGLVMSG